MRDRRGHADIAMPEAPAARLARSPPCSRDPSGRRQVIASWVGREGSQLGRDLWPLRRRDSREISGKIRSSLDRFRGPNSRLPPGSERSRSRARSRGPSSGPIRGLRLIAGPDEADRDPPRCRSIGREARARTKRTDSHLINGLPAVPDGPSCGPWRLPRGSIEPAFRKPRPPPTNRVASMPVGRYFGCG